MHKRKHKHNILMQRIKTVENSTKLRDCIDSPHEANDNFQLPSLQKQSVWKDVDKNILASDQHNTATDMFCSSEIENTMTKKIMQQWEAIENTLYEDGEQVTHAALLQECVQWRTQIPHLRIVGKQFFPLNMKIDQDSGIDNNEMGNNFSSHSKNIVPAYKLLLKDRKQSPKLKKQTTRQDAIFEMLYEYIISELFPSKDNKIESLLSGFSDVLQIHVTPIDNNTSFPKNTNLNWLDETNSIANRLLNNNEDSIEKQNLRIHRKTSSRASTHVMKNRIQNVKDKSILEDKPFRPHASRNKLGTIFNEKIVVSPVPYILSTRESFSTVKTMPIKLMSQSLEVSTIAGSSRNFNYIKNVENNSTSAQISNYQSAWHTPVSPAVWPKNIKLAPLDTSRLHNNKNRFQMSSLHRNRKSLSPITQPILPMGAHTSHDNKNKELEIHGTNISPGQSSKSTTPIIGSKNVESSTRKKERSQLKRRP